MKKRYVLIAKQIPRPSDAAELTASGVKIVDILFAGACLIVESSEDLKYTLDPEMWDVTDDVAEEPASDAPVAS